MRSSLMFHSLRVLTARLPLPWGSLSQMKIILLCLTVFLAPLHVSAQLTGNVLARTLLIHHGNMFGSAFVIDYDGQQYMVTANHIFSNAADRAKVELDANSQWHSFDFKVLHGADKCDDVAVLIP